MWYYAMAKSGVEMAKQKPKDKGTKTETDVVVWAKKHGFHRAVRIALTGSKDSGDVKISDAVMVQVKDGYTEKREPTDYNIGTWLAEVDAQKHNGGWEIALLVHKKWYQKDPDNWRWYIDGRTFLFLATGARTGGNVPPYVQLQGYAVPPLLRGAGVVP